MNRYIRQNINLLKVYFLGAIVLSIFRIIYFIRFAESGAFSEYTADIFIAFLKGFRYDTQILCYLLALIFILNFLFLFKNPKVKVLLTKFTKGYLLCIYIFMCFFIIVDHQFYTYFQSHLNVLAFGFIDDDTSAVLSSVWTDHPVIIVFIIVLALGYFFYKIINKIYGHNTKEKAPIHIIKGLTFMVLLIISFGLGVRGSVGVFPLKMEDAVVSENRFINTLALNGIYTFEKAIEERSNAEKPVHRLDILKKTGYSSVNEILADYTGKKAENFTSENYLDYLIEKSDSNSFLAKNPPNVIFILMESFGGYYLNFHSEKLNLLGSLEPHLKEGILFKDFLSSTQGTIYSLEHIFINKNYPVISGTNRRFESFKSSVAYPYTQAGYQTTFVSGGKISWRNLEEFLSNQYFQTVYGQTKIMKSNNQAKTNTWGVYDEYLFDNIFNQLQQNNTSPQLICALTTTNHTPYELPPSYQPYSINISDSIHNIIIANKELAEANFRAYQYSNDCLGRFLTRLKASKFAENTIIAVTGDHNSYALFPINNSSLEEKDNHIVPFYLYIPKKYQENLIINQNRIGSHKDIFPTLINLSLSNQPYFSLGDNLFSNKPDSLFYGVNEKYYLGPQNFPKNQLDKRVNARRILSEYYFAIP